MKFYNLFNLFMYTRSKISSKCKESMFRFVLDKVLIKAEGFSSNRK